MNLENYVRKRIKYYKETQQYKVLDNFECLCEKKYLFLIDEGTGLDKSTFFRLSPDYFKEYFREYMYLYNSKRYFVWYMEFFKKREAPSYYRKISKPKKKVIKKRDKHKCVLCGETIDLTIDHIYPWSIYHDSSFYNLVTMCETCNQKKADSIAYSEKLKELVITNSKEYE